MSQRINTVIVGGGLAGLAISYYLKQLYGLKYALRASAAWV